MKQPKFSFGDKVKRKDSNHTFYINGIYRLVYIEKETYSYNSTWREAPHAEDELEICNEPQKKILYAYGTETHFKIEFYDRKLDRVNGLIRIPEYDIEYPETNKSEK